MYGGDQVTLQEVQENIKQLILETSQEIKTQISDINSEIRAVKTKVTILENRDKQYSEQLNFIQKELRKNNLIIFGLVEEDEEDILQKVLDLFNNTLKVSVEATEINITYRFGKKEKSRPVLVKFVTTFKKIEVLKNGKLLKNTQVAISNDLTKEDREKQKILRDHLKIAKAENLEAKIVRNQLLVNSTFFNVNQLMEMSKQGNTEGIVQNSSKITPTINDTSTTQDNASTSTTPKTSSVATTQLPNTKQANVQVPKTKSQSITFKTYITRAKTADQAQGTKK